MKPLSFLKTRHQKILMWQLENVETSRIKLYFYQKINICSKCSTPKTDSRPVSIQVQLNHELKVHTNIIASINPDRTQSVYSGICPTYITQSITQGSHKFYSQYQSGYNSVCILRYLSYRYNQFISQFISTFQESDSGRLLFPNQETITLTLYGY